MVSDLKPKKGGGAASEASFDDFETGARGGVPGGVDVSASAYWGGWELRGELVLTACLFMNGLPDGGGASLEKREAADCV